MAETRQISSGRGVEARRPVGAARVPTPAPRRTPGGHGLERPRNTNGRSVAEALHQALCSFDRVEALSSLDCVEALSSLDCVEEEPDRLEEDLRLLGVDPVAGL